MDKEENFYDLIKKFNEIYKLPINKKPTLLGVERLQNFKSVLLEEINEIDEIIEEYREMHKRNKETDISTFGNTEQNENKISENLTQEQELEILTSIADWLGDMVVYITSEATKHGLELDETLKIIMQSNFSKLGKDGKPIYDERGKVMKGPNYWKPEKKIGEFLRKSYLN